MTAIISVRDLTVSFRNDDEWTPVVRNVSFDVHAGETVSLVGESGSGKSVTALSVMRLLNPVESRIDGEIRLDGRDIARIPETAMQSLRGNDIAMVFQEPMTSLNPVMTIGRQIREVLVRHRGLHGAAADYEAVRLLERVQIPAAKSRIKEYPHNFSGGMRQRVMIAMALACSPKLLIADEPTTALDVTIQAQIIELLRKLQAEEGMAILFITHDMGVVAELADRTVVMYRGEVVEAGATSDVFAKQTHAYTRTLLSAVPVLGSMKGVPGPAPFPTTDPTTGSARSNTLKRSTVNDGPPVLEVRNLSTRYVIRSGLFGKVAGRIHAVENVSFTVRPRETLSLVGESGCGKSTTGRSVLRLVEPVEGQILLEGVDVRSLGSSALREKRRGMQMIFQDPFASLNPSVRVGYSIMEPLLIHGVCDRTLAKVRAIDLLERVGLSREMFSRFPHEFSGGQRQRVCIARALALEPKLIIADEAVSALDVSIKAQVVNLLLDLQESLGLSYLFISHDMAVVERVSHRVAVMYLGEIVEIGPREAVFSNPQHSYTKRLLSAVPIPNPALRGTRPRLAAPDLRSPVRPPDFRREPPRYKQIGKDHFVQVQSGGESGSSLEAKHIA